MARKRRNEVVEEFDPAQHAAPRREELRAIGELQKSFDKWRPARIALTKVWAVPTLFPYFDYASQVGGWPTQRVGVLRGPSSEGKSELGMGIGAGHLARGHYFFHVDAEMTTPIDFPEMLMGAELAHSPRYRAMRPSTYEECQDGVRSAAHWVAEQVAKGRLPPMTTGFFLIDSIRKLWPKRLRENVERVAADSKEGSVDGMKGAAGMYRAQVNAMWLDELTPLMHDTNCSVLLIARETTDMQASAMDRQWGRDKKLSGGGALKFDSSVSLRNSRDAWIYEGGSKERGEKGTVVGERHLVEIEKTKVGKQQGRASICYFHTSMGNGAAPRGLDPARDLLLLGKRLGVVQQSEKSSWMQYGVHRWQGEVAAVRRLYADGGSLMRALEEELRAKFPTARPPREVTEDGEVVE